MASLPSVSQVGTLSPFRPSRCPDDANSAHPGPSTASPTCSPCAILLSFFSTSPVSRMSGAHVHCSTSHIPIAGTPDRGPPHGHCNSSGHCSLQHMCRLHPPLPSPVGAPPGTSAGRPPLPPSSCSFLFPSLLHLSRAPSAAQGIMTFSHRCHFSHLSSSARPTHPPNTPSVRSGDSSSFLPCSWLPFALSTVLVEGGRRRTPPSPMQPHCRHSGWTEPTPPCCPVGFCNLHCHQPSLCGPRPSFPVGKRPGGRLADGRRHREPLFCRSLFWFWGQFNCRRL